MEISPKKAILQHGSFGLGEQNIEEFASLLGEELDTDHQIVD
jgi:hypothetical protein